MGIFGPVNFVALKVEESSRMAQHAHGLRFKTHYELDGMCSHKFNGNS
jgi:hypothetical protein